MKRMSPDTGRRRARRRDAGADAEVMPLCVAGVFAAAAVAMATLVTPASLRFPATATAALAACDPPSVVHACPTTPVAGDERDE